MGKYEYFRKIRTNGNLLIFCQTTTTYFGAKMATYERGTEFGIFAVKVNFPANSVFKQLFSCFQ